jgi:predicted transcriptional regulator of viral defense system
VQIASSHRYASTVISGRPLKVVFERRDTLSLGTEPAGHGAAVSTLERALLDAASRPDLVGGYFPLAEALTGSSPDASQLLDLAAQLNASPGLRRIGSLADRLDLPNLADRLRPLSPPEWDLDLDPGLKEMSHVFRDGDWRVRWPTRPATIVQELKN